jgi:hypothetical protein
LLSRLTTFAQRNSTTVSGTMLRLYSDLGAFAALLMGDPMETLAWRLLPHRQLHS